MTPEVAAAPPGSKPPKPRWLRLPLSAPAKVRKLDDEGLVELKVSRRTSAQLAGVRYEKRAIEQLRKELPGIEIGVWWEWYEGKSGMLRRISQTDGFWLNPDGDLAAVIEIKHHHTSDAWWQLREYYLPIVRGFLGPRVNINVVEVCRTFDPAVRIPDPIYLIESGALYGWCSQVHPPDAFGVYRCRLV